MGCFYVLLLSEKKLKAKIPAFFLDANKGCLSTMMLQVHPFQVVEVQPAVPHKAGFHMQNLYYAYNTFILHLTKAALFDRDHRFVGDNATDHLQLEQQDVREVSIFLFDVLDYILGNLPSNSGK